MDLSSFALGNGPVSFKSFLRAPKPPSNLGATINLTETPISSSSALIGGAWGTLAVAGSVGAAVYGGHRTKAIMRTLGSLSLTILYLGSKEKN